MYEYFHGTLASKKPSQIVVDVGGVAYRLNVPISTYEALPGTGAEVRVYTYLKVGDDAMTLYGFASLEERRIFTELIDTISGLGPRKALAILSSTTIPEFRAAVDGGDAARLRRIKGIGARLADKIIFELKGKLPQDEGLTPELTSKKGDAIYALVSLGWGRKEAESAVERTLQEQSGDAISAEELVKHSLRHV